MRPIQKGPCPIDINTGLDKVVSSYDAWRKDLIERIGPYCVYCNMPLSHNLQVEHVIAKNPLPGQPQGLLLAWANMLLACGPCNYAKGNRLMLAPDCFTPEDFNTHLYFETNVPVSHPDAAIIQPRTGLSNSNLICAQNTINLLKLSEIDRRSAVVDIRWKHRFNALQAVSACQKLLFTAKSSPVFDEEKSAELIATIARGIGFFSLWLDAFEDDPMVIKKLIDPAFIPGTNREYFETLKYSQANQAKPG